MKSDTSGVGAGGVRNLRTKTVRPQSTSTSNNNHSNIPVKRTSSIEKENVSSEVLTEKVPSPAKVFPVKSVLKRGEDYSNFDKENIDPMQVNAIPDWDDLDSEDSGDPLMVSDYVIEIFDYMSQLEVNLVLIITFNFIVVFFLIETSGPTQ